MRYLTIADLPETIPVFPLTGILLLPRGQLPLNIFEPRYLAMIDAAMSGNRMIGMIQPSEPEDKVLKPALSPVGCVGRITSYRETDEGNYLITLTGVSRFRLIEELAADTPFRLVKADYTPYAADMASGENVEFPRDRLIAALKDYLSHRDLNADWGSVINAPPETLVNALAMLCPFAPAEKQALLEASDWKDRVDTLVALLEISGAPVSGGNTLN